MNTELQSALDTLLDVQDASGLNRKKELLMYHKNNQTLQDILYFVYNPFIKTGIGLAKIKKINYELLVPEDIDKWTMQGMITYLVHNYTGRDADVIHVIQFVKYQKERFTKLLYDIFTKNLKLGVSTTTFNKIWPDLIPGFSVQLACKWQDNLEYLKGKYIFVTEKLDGNRCFARVKDGKCMFLSRSGKEITGLDDVEQDLLKLPPGWYDGELIGENFNETQKQTLKKGKKTNLVFNVFDYLTFEEVEHQKCYHKYVGRRFWISWIFSHRTDLTFVKDVPVIYEGPFDEIWILHILDEYTSKGSEGIMINTNAKYQFGRTCDLLKVKKMYNLDLRVVDITEGSGENQNRVGALVVDYKGFRVGVGSGLSKEQRIYWWEHPEDIIGSIIEIKYFEESKDKNGNLSLRFPVFIQERPDKNEPSYD